MISRTLRAPFIALLITVLISFTQTVLAQNQAQPCPNGYWVGVISGIGSNWADAVANSIYLQLRLGNAYKGEPITYEPLPNPTRGYAADLRELQNQRRFALTGERPDLAELRAERGRLAARITRASNSIFQSTYLNARTPGISGETQLALIDERILELTTEDSHRQWVDQRIAARQRFLLVGHSQGTVYALRAYRYAQERLRQSPESLGLGSVEVLLIAPAAEASEVGDLPYVLATQDSAISTWAVPLSGRSVKPSLWAPDGLDSEFNHSFILTYLTDPAALQAVLFRAVTALERLRANTACPFSLECREAARRGRALSPSSIYSEYDISATWVALGNGTTTPTDGVTRVRNAPDTRLSASISSPSSLEPRFPRAEFTVTAGFAPANYEFAGSVVGDSNGFSAAGAVSSNLYDILVFATDATPERPRSIRLRLLTSASSNGRLTTNPKAREFTPGARALNLPPIDRTLFFESSGDREILISSPCVAVPVFTELRARWEYDPGSGAMQGFYNARPDLEIRNPTPGSPAPPFSCYSTSGRFPGCPAP